MGRLHRKKGYDMPITGRPTDYKEEYCQDVIEHLRGGNSLASFAVSIGTNRQRLWQWREKYPNFQDACTTAIDYSLKWWENLSVQIATGSIFSKDHKGKYKKHNPGMVQFIMKQRFAEYRRMSQPEQPSPPIALNINVSKDSLETMSDDDLNEKVAEALKVLDNGDDDRSTKSGISKRVSKKAKPKPAKRKSKKKST